MPSEVYIYIYIYMVCKNKSGSTESDINTRLAKAWTAIGRLSVIWKSDLSDKRKPSFFPSSGCVNNAIWMHLVDTITKCMEKKLDRITQECYELYWTSPGGNNTTKQQLYGHLPPITKTIPIRRIRRAGHCWKSKGELTSDVLLWTPSKEWTIS